MDSEPTPKNCLKKNPTSGGASPSTDLLVFSSKDGQNKSPFTSRDNVRGWTKPVKTRSSSVLGHHTSPSRPSSGDRWTCSERWRHAVRAAPFASPHDKGGIGILKTFSESGTLLERGETLPLRGTTPGATCARRRPAMQGRDDRMRGWARDTARPRPRVGDGGSVIRRAALSLAATDRTQILEWVPDRRSRTRRSDRTRSCPGAAPEPETVEGVGWGDRDRRGARARIAPKTQTSRALLTRPPLGAPTPAVRRAKQVG